MKTFDILDISGDIGLRAYGKTPLEAFRNIAVGMYSLIVDPDTIAKVKTIKVSVKSHSAEGLLVSWLNELIFHFDTYGFIGKEIKIENFILQSKQPEDLEDCILNASLTGEDFDNDRHEGKLLIKAATYHKLKIEKKDKLWEIDVIFDI